MNVGKQNAAEFHPEADDVFSRIAGTYDRLCDVFSLFAHRAWKSHISKRIVSAPGSVVLDVASGTGDIPLRVLRRLDGSAYPEGKKIIVSDLCPAMLAVARKKIGTTDVRVEYQTLDAHNLKEIESSSVDVYSISFGMKIMDRERVLSEAWRVLKPGGRFFCLEAARIPMEPVHRAYLGYMGWCLPLIARVATRGDSSAYNYLLMGLREFPRQQDFAEQIRSYGFEDVSYENLTLGIVALHTGVKR